jgi:hypothetical protein
MLALLLHGSGLHLSERFCRDGFRNVRIVAVSLDNLDDFSADALLKAKSPSR